MTARRDFTIGIEEEYLVINKDTLSLVTRMPPELMAECYDALGEQVKKELLQCQIEIGTKVCSSIQEARDDLIYLRGTVAEIARKHDCLIMASSTHPFSYGATLLTDDARYLDLAQQLQRIVASLYISGMHVHVGIADNDRRVDYMNQTSYLLPHLLALSTSSPFWRGEDTGLRSYRVCVFDQLPRTGIPPSFYSYSDYMKHVNVLVNLDIIENASKIWWDLRPSWTYPTLELRITDICTNVDDAISIATTYRCWLRMLSRLRKNNQRWREYSSFLIQENRWRAQRYSIDRGLIDFGREEIIETDDLVDELISLVYEDAHYFGCVDELLHLQTILERGTSAHQQLDVYNKSIDEGLDNKDALLNVVKHLAKETLRGVNFDI